MTPIIIPENEQLIELMGQEPALHLEPMLEGNENGLLPFIVFDQVENHRIMGVLFV